MGLTKKQREIRAARVVFALKGGRFEVGDTVRVHCPEVGHLHGKVAKVEFVATHESSRPWYHLEGVPLVAFLNEDLRMVFK
jgi:hypothetical protein